MGAKRPEQIEAMAIHRNEFATYAETVAAVAEFPRCGQCKGAVKIGQVGGCWFALCTKHPTTHRSIRKIA